MPHTPCRWFDTPTLPPPQDICDDSPRLSPLGFSHARRHRQHIDTRHALRFLSALSSVPPLRCIPPDAAVTRWRPRAAPRWYGAVPLSLISSPPCYHAATCLTSSRRYADAPLFDERVIAFEFEKAHDALRRLRASAIRALSAHAQRNAVCGAYHIESDAIVVAPAR